MNLSFDGVAYTYPNGVQAIRGVDLRISSGEQVAWIGGNGAGKSTLARLANGLLRPERGSVSIGDWDTRQHTVGDISRRVGYIFQNPDEQLFATSLKEEVAFGPRNLRVAPAEIEARVEESLSALDLLGEADRNPYDLSPARRKDLGIAAVLAMRPSILILDEPTTGQDGFGLARLGKVLDQARARRQTMILITHDMEFCSAHADRLTVFDDGRITADGPTLEVFRRSGTLAEAQIEPPQLVRLAERLGLAEPAWDEESFLSAWWASRPGRVSL